MQLNLLNLLNLRNLLMTTRTPLGAQPEFLPGVDQPPIGATRREFLRWFWASAAMAVTAGCGRVPNEKRYPYNQPPPGVTPGIPQHYATAHVVGGFATGLVVKSREGRPLKVEGNPEHPASLGASGVLEQGMVLDVYDPRRLADITRDGQPRTWEHLTRSLARGLAAQPDRGRGLRFVLPPTGSPLHVSLIEAIRAELPEARWSLWEPTQSGAALEATRRIAGHPLQPHYRLAQATRVVSLDADFMGQMPFALRNARDFAAGRRIEAASDEMNRLYVVEAKPTVTGALADDRLACKSSEVGVVAAQVLLALLALTDPSALVDGADDCLRSALPALERLDRSDRIARFAGKLAADSSRATAAARSSSPAIASPGRVHVIAHAINELLGNLGGTVVHTAPVLFEPDGATLSIPALTDQMRRGEVRTLVIAGLNPVYALPPALGFSEALSRVETSVYWGLFSNETAQRCTWTVPARHPLESWGDAVAYDGTVTFLQPLIDPLGDAHTLDELLALFIGRPTVQTQELLRELWGDRLAAFEPASEPESDREAALDRAFQLGLLPGSASPPVTAPPLPAELLAQAVALTASEPGTAGEIELALYESPCVRDGAYAHNAWLQELPEPITKLTWGNPWMLSPATAEKLGVEDGDVLEVSVDQRPARGPVVSSPPTPTTSCRPTSATDDLPDRPHFNPLHGRPRPGSASTPLSFAPRSTSTGAPRSA